MYAFLFPGQGVLRVGMGRWLRAQPEAAEVFSAASDLLSVDFGQLCARGPLATLVATENAQPAVTVCGLAALAVLRARGVEPSVVAGHSVGEIAALHAAGAIDFEPALRLVFERARLMARITDDGAMCAVLGLADEVVEEIAASVGVVVGLENAPGHLVLSGARSKVEEGAAKALAAGARKATPLEVSNAFHSPLMAPAAADWAAVVADVTLATPDCPVIPNVDAVPTTDPARLKAALVEQLTGRVRWTASMEAVAGLGVTECVEVGDSKVLCGLARNCGLRGHQMDAALLRRLPAGQVV